MREFHLTQDQVSQQLQNYKKEKYQHIQINIILGLSDLRQRMHDSLTTSTLDFVTETLTQIGNPQPVDGADFKNYSSSINEFPPAVSTYLRLLVVSPENWCISLLVSLINFWIDAMAEIFPKTSARIPNAQLGFDRRKQSYMEIFIDNFVAEYDSTSLTQTITKIAFGHLSGFLHTSLFMAWSHLVCDREKPSVKLPSNCLVGYFAIPVIYFVAGWTIYKVYKALTVARGKSPVYYRLQICSCAEYQCKFGKSIGLTTDLVDRRQCGSSMYCTQQYFYFICFVESIYLANLMLEMMMAYNNSTIISVIKTSILSSNLAMENVDALLAGDAVDNNERQQLMAYVTDWYANMRGTYFVKHLKVKSCNHMKKLIGSQATRTKVANAVY